MRTVDTMMRHKILKNQNNHQTIRLERDTRICKTHKGQGIFHKDTDTHASKELQLTCLQQAWPYRVNKRPIK